MISMARKQIYATKKIASSVFKFVLVLHQGQAAVERGFSVNNKVLNVNVLDVTRMSVSIFSFLKQLNF